MTQDRAQSSEHFSGQVHGGFEVQVPAARRNPADLHRRCWTCQAAETNAQQMQEAQGGLLSVSADNTCYDVSVEQRCHHKTVLFAL